MNLELYEAVWVTGMFVCPLYTVNKANVMDEIALVTTIGY